MKRLMTHMQRCILFAIIGGLMFSSTHLRGQATASATVQGTVTDQTGAVIGKADVTLTAKETGAVRSSKTNNAGEYRFDGLNAGVYTVKTTASGFTTGEAKEVEVQIGRTLTQDFALKPGAVSETVEVTAVAPLVDKTKTDVSTNITPQQIQDLPMINRDIADLAYLAPGVHSADAYDPTKVRMSILSVNGQGGRNVNVTIDGVDNKDNTVGGPVMQVPAEAVQEFQISTQRFSAVNGRSAGAAINVITKSGTNAYHGSAFGDFREQAFNAAQKVPNGDGTTSSVNPPYARQWFGGSFGGPIKKDKLFAFFAMERQREQSSIAEDPAAFQQLSLLTGPPFNAQPSQTIPTPFYENRINGRMDWTINNKHSAYFSVTTQGNNNLNDQGNATSDLTDGNFTINHMNVANLTINSALTPSLINQFTIGTQYWNNLIDSTGRTPNYSFPLGRNTINIGTNANVPQQSIQRKIQFKDDVSKSVGRHTFKTGVDSILTPFMGGFFEFTPTLNLTYNKTPSQILALPAGFQTPGLVDEMQIAVGDPTFIIKDAKQLGLYFQDDWKVTNRLTANIGLRYDRDFDFIGGSDIGNSRTFQELQAMAPFSKLAASLVAKKASDFTKGFSPRVGFAYDLNGHGNHVVRAGFGMYYDNTFQNIPLFMEQQSNPTIFQIAFDVTQSDLVPGTNVEVQNWALGVNPMPTIPGASGALNPGSVGRLMDPNFRVPVTEEFNGGYSWTINSKSVLEAEYVHVLSLHENKAINVDPKIPIDPNNITTLSKTQDAAGNPVCTAGSCGFFQPLDAAANAAGVPVLSRVADSETIGRSRYDAMNISFRQRGFHRTDLIANYTLSRTVGYDSDGGGFGQATRDPRNPFSQFEFGPSFNDERHHVTLAATSHLLPWGLEFSPIVQIGSARPYNATAGTNLLGLGGGSQANPLVVTNANPTDFTSGLNLPPVVDSATITPANPNGTPSLKLATARCYYAGDCHLSPYNPLRGDPYFNMDMRLAKNLKLGENRNLQLHFQAFNVTNHANYGSNFGEIAGTSSFEHPVGFINPTSSFLPRAFTGEFGARFTF